MSCKVKGFTLRLRGQKLSMQSLLPSVKGIRNRDSNNKHKEDAYELNPPVKPEETKCSQPFDSRFFSNSTVKNGTAKKNEHKSDHSSYLDLSFSTPEYLSNVISPGPTTLVPSSSLLPVLRLCAPNASQRHSISRTFRTPASKQVSHHGQIRSAVGLPEFLSAPADVSARPSSDTGSREVLTDPLTLLDTPRKAFNTRSKNIILDNYFPFGSSPTPNLGRVLSDLGESSCTSFSSFHEKLGLPKLDLDDKFPMEFAFPSSTSLKQQTDFLPSLSLSTKMELANSCNPDLSSVPLVPKFIQELDEKLKQKQQLSEFPLVLDLGTMQTSHRLPENHKKVLDNIIMRTRTAAHKFWKKRIKADTWSEDELDALWICIHRHGRGNWDAMLRDPKFRILKHKSIEELSSKWSKEQCKIIDGPASFPRSYNLTSGLSVGLMALPLHDCKCSAIWQEPSKSHSHFTDINLDCGDLLPKFSCFEKSSHEGAVNGSLPLLPSGLADIFGSSYFQDMSPGMLNRLEKTNLPSDQFVLHNSLPGSLFGSPGMISSSSLNEDDVWLAAARTMKLPISHDKSPSLFHGAQNINSGESSFELPFYAKKKHVFNRSQLDDNFPGCSKPNQLPHWYHLHQP